MRQPVLTVTDRGIWCPAGDFFGCAHGRVTAYQSAVHSVGPKAGMNLWLPMPFTARARLSSSCAMPATPPEASPTSAMTSGRPFSKWPGMVSRSVHGAPVPR